MKGYIIAFLTLAAVASSTSIHRSDSEKRAYLHFLESKFSTLAATTTTRRGASSDDTCHIKTCAGWGSTCNGDIICSGLLGCVNNTCRTSSPGDDCSYDDHECYSSSLYCDHDRCRKYASVGDLCSTDADCHSKEPDTNPLHCTVRSEYRGVGHCAVQPEKYCTHDGKFACNTYSEYCTATAESRFGVCQALPATVGAPCDPAHGYGGCNLEVNLYCVNETRKCGELPKEGEDCFKKACYPGYECKSSEKKCHKVEYKKMGEECSKDKDCEGENSTCAYNVEEKKKICMNKIAKMGEYCNNGTRMAFVPSCVSPLACVGFRCINNGYQCTTNDDCKYKLLFKIEFKILFLFLF